MRRIADALHVEHSISIGILFYAFEKFWVDVEGQNGSIEIRRKVENGTPGSAFNFVGRS